MNVIALHRLLETLFNPLTGILFLYACSLLWLFSRGNGRGLRVCLCFVLIGLLILSTGWLPEFMSRKLERQYAVVETVNPAIHWVVVLGGGELEGVSAPVNHLLVSATIQRLLEGVRLYRQLPGAKLLLSGGGYDDQNPAKSVAARMGEFTTWFMIPSSDLVLETTSLNTADEAVAIKQVVHNAPFYLVTSAMHMPRAMALCHKQGLNPVAAPADYPYEAKSAVRKYEKWIPNPVHLSYIKNAWHEVIGQIWGGLTGQL